MKKEQYLLLRTKGDWMAILYVYALERFAKESIGSIETFKAKFISWFITGEQKQQIYNKVLDLYDKKFAIQL